MPFKIFLCGLDNTGKTSITNVINELPNPGETDPTLNCLAYRVIIELTEFVIWDAPGQVIYRSKWAENIEKSAILCYVVDVLDKKRYAESREWLDRTLASCENKTIPIVICFHKLDKPKAEKLLPKAKKFFKPEDFPNHPVYLVDTTIFRVETISALKTLFIEALVEFVKGSAS